MQVGETVVLVFDVEGMPAGKEGLLIKVRDDMLLIRFRSADRLEFVLARAWEVLPGANGGCLEREWALTPYKCRALQNDSSHYLSIGINVGSGDIALRTDLLADAFAGHAFQLSLRKKRRFACDAAFCSTERYVYHRSLPGHRRRKSADVMSIQRGVKAQAAFGWSTAPSYGEIGIR
jgi:hypothetical protein